MKIKEWRNWKRVSNVQDSALPARQLSVLGFSRVLCHFSDLLSDTIDLR